MKYVSLFAMVALAAGGFFAPPYYSSDFTYILRLADSSLKPCWYGWRPECLTRVVTNDRFRVETRLYPVAGERVFDVTVTMARGVEVMCEGREYWVANGRTVTLPSKRG